MLCEAPEWFLSQRQILFPIVYHVHLYENIDHSLFTSWQNKTDQMCVLHLELTAYNPNVKSNCGGYQIIVWNLTVT